MPFPENKQQQFPARPWVVVTTSLAGAAVLWVIVLAGRGNSSPSPVHRSESMASLEIPVKISSPTSSHIHSRAAWVSESEPPLPDFCLELVRQLEAESDSEQRTMLLCRFVADYPAAQLAAAVQSLAQPGMAGVAAELRQLLLRRWVGLDASLAAKWAEGLSDAGLRQESLEQVAVVWAGADMESAAAWAQALPPETRSAALLAVGYEAVRTQPLLALDLAAELPESPARTRLLEHGIGEWAVIDSAEALAWVEQIPDETLRASLLSRLATVWADENPQAAAELAVSELPSGGAQDRAIVGVVQRWAEVAPAAAAAWVEEFPAGPVRTAAVQNLISLWAEQDLASPAAWLRGLPTGDLRDAGIAQFAQGLAPQSLPAAQLWSAIIEDPSQRLLCEQAISRLFPASSATSSWP